ncbi:hypothetical protein [Gorillibacterium sp. CAU 1737]|uniref:hypothetical protein n=1 Tax=Gorillibacterium sp. CAU 1737 TaxID=3140362 RepID=UPI003260DCF9
MVTSKKIELRLEHVFHTCDTELIQYGKMVDSINDFTYSFHDNQVYGLLSECADGAWIVAYILTGKTQIHRGKITLNGKNLSPTDLRNITCYIGDYSIKKFPRRNKTVREQLKEALRFQEGATLESIVEMFELSESRLDRRLWEISNERWNATAAIGYANNKRVFCFPWFNGSWTAFLAGRIPPLATVLKQSGCTVLLPVGSLEHVEPVLDTCLTINDGKIKKSIRP